MIDIIIPVYINYDLLYHQFERYRHIIGEWRLLVCDNTPIEQSRAIIIPEYLNGRVQLFRNDSGGIDGERHGGVIDYMVRQSTSDIIGIHDTDYFWLDNNILEYVQRFFDSGYKCVGTELYYNNFEYVNKLYPQRHGCLAPCVFGMFIDRQLALSDTFVVTRHEGCEEKRETGWRIRQKIIQENIKSIVFPAVQHPAQKYSMVPRMNYPWFYAGNRGFLGVHLVGGTSYNIDYTSELLKEIYKIINQ
jgi:hypothetical protein